MKTAKEMKEFKGTKGEWTINHWKQGGSGVTYKGEANGITHYTGDNVYREEYRIVSNLHPNSHEIEHSFEGAHIAEIAARSEESLANAHLIAAAPELLDALIETDKDLCVLEGNMVQIEKSDPRADGMTTLVSEWRKRNKKAINKALGK